MAKRITGSTPKLDGYRMPAEFEPQAGVWMLWPERNDNWRDGAKPAQKAFLDVATAILQFEPVTVCVSPAQYQNARERLPRAVRVVEMASNDAWIRDCGPTFLVNDNGGVRAVDWMFNAWGGLVDGLYFPWDLDDQVAQKVCEIERVDSYRTEGFVLEGGSIHVDGEGTVLTTEMCLLSEGRNPDMDRGAIERMLCDYLGCEKVLWLRDGIDPEETNGHIDDVACFIRPGEVACIWTDDPQNPFYQPARDAYDMLSQATDAKGRKLKVHKLCLTQQPCLLQGAATIDAVEGTIPREDGEVAILGRDGIQLFNAMELPIEKEHHHIDWEISAAEKGGYEHFMLKEIMEQPRAIKSTLDPRVKDHRVVFDELKMTDAQLVGFNKIMITACGSAFYAGQAGKYALEKLTHIPVDADLASEFRYRDPIVDEHTLMIIISQSGETADTIAAIREAQSKGAYVLSIVNVVGSTIARISDDVIYTWAGPEIAVATTKGYTTQVSVLYLLALYLGEKRGCLSREEAAKLTDDLMILPQMVQRAIDLNPQIAQLAERYKNNPSLFFIGRNVDYAVCMEGSLKLKEISYLHSEAYAAGELKHGTIALIEENRLVIAVACYEPLFDKTMSNVKEVKARGARVLGVALEGNRAIYSEADDVILVPRMDDLFVVPAEIVPLQLFAYYVAKANGCAIDKPKNLAKSVTVE